jgi:phosphoglycerate dehydrogenase-like enzyme
VPASGRPDLLAELADLAQPLVVQALSAGVDWLEKLVPEQATLCSARGARDAPVAEWILGALLGASTGLLECAARRAWDSDRQLRDLGSCTVLVVGMGSIGRRLQQQLTGLGTNVVAVASRARDDLHGIDELDTLLPDADAVVLLTPLTDSTRGLIGAHELARMRDGALLVNAARGPVLDADALLAELQAGRLQAVLDVTDPEPLPDDHPLWRAPGLLSITPHIAGDSPAGNAGAAALAADQLVRWATGEPLLNVVSKGAS